MTTAADDSVVEDAFEALLAGRPVPEGAAGLAAFTEAVRASATRPGRPSAALAELLTTGLLTDQSSPSARTAPSAGAPPSRRGARTRNRRRFAMIFPVLLAKLLSAGAVAQAAAGAGIVVVAVTGAGVAGVLPDPLQDTVATAVETVTPLELTDDDETVPEDGSTGEEPLPETTPVVEEPTDEDVVDELPAEDAEFSAATWAEEGPDAYPSFGAWVSEGARHGAHKELGVRFGELVSSRAHEKGLDAEELEAEGVDLDALTDVTTEPAPEEETEVAQTEPQEDESAVATPQRGNGKAAGGNGNANSNGNGGGKSSGNAGGKGNGRN